MFSQICGELHQYTQIFLLSDSDPFLPHSIPGLDIALDRENGKRRAPIVSAANPVPPLPKRDALRLAKRMSIYAASDKFVPATVANAFHAFFEPLDIDALIILDNRAALD